MRGVRGIEELVDWGKLADACSAIVGTRLIPHPLRKEWTHVNVQNQTMDRPVDRFHYDYVSHTCPLF
jgi:hypothetical protein